MSKKKPLVAKRAAEVPLTGAQLKRRLCKLYGIPPGPHAFARLEHKRDQDRVLVVLQSARADVFQGHSMRVRDGLSSFGQHLQRRNLLAMGASEEDADALTKDSKAESYLCENENLFNVDHFYLLATILEHGYVLAEHVRRGETNRMDLARLFPDSRTANKRVLGEAYREVLQELHQLDCIAHCNDPITLTTKGLDVLCTWLEQYEPVVPNPTQ